MQVIKETRIIDPGLAFETRMPVPISSGGSTANMSSFKVATATLTLGLFEQTHVVNPAS